MPQVIKHDPNPYRRLFKRFGRWNINVRVTNDHRLFTYLPEFASWTRADHEGQSVQLRELANLQLSQGDRLATKALETYGDHGSLTAGCIRTHFPEPVKAMLRRLYYGSTETFDRSLAHWRAAGRQTKTWRDLRNRTGAGQ